MSNETIRLAFVTGIGLYFRFRRWSALLFLLLTILGQVACTNLFLQPHRQQVLHPSKLHLAYEDIYLPVSHGEKVHGWYLAAKGEAVGTILYLHGNAENISTHIAGVAWLPSKNFNVLLLDYRGYGASEGKSDLVKAHEDVEIALDYLVARGGIDRNRLVIFGQSLGGAIAIYTAAHTAYQPFVKAVIVESAFSSYRGIAREKIADIWLTWPFQYPLSWLFSDQFSPQQAIVSLRSPLLIMHGENDVIVPSHHADQLYRVAHEPKTLWKVPGAGHIQIFADLSYRERFVNWLLSVLNTDGAIAERE